MAETCALISATVTMFYIVSWIGGVCIIKRNDDFLVRKEINLIQFTCPDGYYNRLATLLFDSQIEIIQTLMSSNNNFTFLELFIFFLLWSTFSSISAGTAVPSGIFMPCIIMGCALGHIYDIFHKTMFPFSLMKMKPETLAILGASAVLSGSTRMNYSLAVIMLETTSNVDMFLPILFTLFASFGTGSLLNIPIYTTALRNKNIPIL